jgi:hypothetical protein
MDDVRPVMSWIDRYKNFQVWHPSRFQPTLWREYVLSSVPDTLHVQKLEPHEIGTNLFPKNFYDIIVWSRYL